MVYFKSVRCNDCGVLMHSTCSSSSHFCHQVRLQEGKSISPRHSTSSQASPHLLLHHHHHGTNHHHNHLHRAKPHNPNLFVNSSNLDWQFMSLPFDSTTAVHSPPSRPCSALPFDCQQFLQANEAPTSAFPFPVSSFEPDVFEDPIENSAEGASSNFHLHHHPRSPMEQWGNHLATNIRHLKNWWQNRKRRNSKELISRANAEDKHVRSRFSLTCDEKQARKQLEHLIKFEAKKRSKVRFDCGAPYGSSGRITSSPEVPSNVVYVYDRPSYGMVTTSTSSLAHARHHNCLSATSAQAEVFQQRLAQIKRNLLQETDRLSIPNTCSASAVCSNELISSGQHVYCASRVGARRRTIPKLFQAQQAQVHPIVLQSSTTHQLPLPVEQDKHLALTKARTLSMEAKSAVCHSFLATWPTSSTVISSENDFLPTEAELNAHVSVDWTTEEDVDEIIKEWCIPSKSIQFRDKIGESRIGSIYKGHWHGEVLIYTYSRSSDGRTGQPNLGEFTRQLAQLTKVRHENIMLFMGACIEPNHLSVITSMQKGCSLHDTLYVKQRNLPLPAKLDILRQVAQAMGYLHARGIVHGKINSNNIIVENKIKICLMDQGVGNRLPLSTRHMMLPRRHLAYLSPELIRSLSVHAAPNYHIVDPFTKESDSYAFGTLLFEMLSNRYPFAQSSWEQVVWQIGHGRHETIEGVKCEPFLKSLLSSCWAQNALTRPAFPAIVKRLQENVSLHKRHSTSEPERLNKLDLSKHI